MIFLKSQTKAKTHWRKKGNQKYNRTFLSSQRYDGALQQMYCTFICSLYVWVTWPQTDSAVN